MTLEDDAAAGFIGAGCASSVAARGMPRMRAHAKANF